MTDAADTNYDHYHQQRMQVTPEQVVDKLLGQEVPKALHELHSSVVNLSQVAEHVDQTYAAVAATRDTQQAFAQAKQFTVQALASVAYQINAASTAILQSMDAQDENVRLLTTEVAGPRRKILMQEEQRGRRAISGLTEPVSRSRKRICAPIELDMTQPPVSRRIDYDALDNLGTGVRVQMARNDGHARTMGGHPPMQQQHPHQQQQHMSSMSATGRASPNGLDTSQLYASVSYGNVSSMPMPAVPSAPRVGGGDPLDIYDMPRNIGAPSMAPPVMPFAPPAIPAVPAVPAPTVPSVLSMAPPPGPPQQPSGATEPAEDNIYGEPLPASTGASTTSMPTMSLLPPPPPPLAAAAATTTAGQTLDDDMYETIDKEDTADSDNLYGMVLPSQALSPPAPPAAEKKTFDLSNLEEYPTAVSTFDYEAEREDELSFKEGEYITILKKNDDGWFEGVIGDRHGLFPGNYCEEVQESTT
ncbi:hypothetical protein PTSG_03604 [Salpingoeca rosetta]|uniref:SH3 domain-containing protein n=1 Tax=Salpingoeca rosetta (strain ATCC 50818 / BSB-021) TaxID=946362 RepID=F2U627_SALR5|nr:uncharacterized protein PTSG_03604 [Salpingoeca rosetta]EGD82968.1 hypothetical protein PTSG_03604 [Salpingoeca rosetta]|eukprot:XP_004995332.1 hypothetical protein PTSG_03604 [Salpingoeca rosetta]